MEHKWASVNDKNIIVINEKDHGDVDNVQIHVFLFQEYT